MVHVCYASRAVASWRVCGRFKVRLLTHEANLLRSTHQRCSIQHSVAWSAQKRPPLSDVAPPTGKKKTRGKLKPELLAPEGVRDFAASGADMVLHLHAVLKPRLVADGLVKIYERIERPLLPVRPSCCACHWCGLCDCVRDRDRRRDGEGCLSGRCALPLAVAVRLCRQSLSSHNMFGHRTNDLVTSDAFETGAGAHGSDGSRC